MASLKKIIKISRRYNFYFDYHHNRLTVKRKNLRGSHLPELTGEIGRENSNDIAKMHLCQFLQMQVEVWINFNFDLTCSSSFSSSKNKN